MCYIFLADWYLLLRMIGVVWKDSQDSNFKRPRLTYCLY